MTYGSTSTPSDTFTTDSGVPGGDSGDTGLETATGRFDALVATWEAQADLEAMVQETYVDDRGCTVPRWLHLGTYSYDPGNQLGQGVHLTDLTLPVDVLSDTPRSALFHVEADGAYTLAGLEWYFEPPGGQPLDEHPILFGVEMQGLMEPHVPGLQENHYDLNAWPWLPSADNERGMFGLFNQGMTVPAFYLDFEPYAYDSFKFTDPGIVATLGYVEQGCVDGEGVRFVRDASASSLDPFLPHMLFFDVDGRWLGAQWTRSAADVMAGPPRLFQQDFAGPDADEQYTLRAWNGARINPDGLFAPTHRFVACDEPTLPPECLPVGLW